MPRTVLIALGAELAAQVADVDVDHVGARVEVVAPDVVEQLLAAEHLAGVQHEDLGQRELARGQVDLRARRRWPGGCAGRGRPRRPRGCRRGRRRPGGRARPGAAAAGPGPAARRTGTASACSRRRRPRAPRPCRSPSRARSARSPAAGCPASAGRRGRRSRRCPGRPMSRTRRSNWPDSASSSPASPSPTTVGWWPSARRPLATKEAMRSSSSTIRMRAMRGPPRRRAATSSKRAPCGSASRT